MNILNKISEHIKVNYEQLILWVPVFFGMGIGVYFLLPFEPEIILYSIYLSILSTILLVIYQLLRLKKIYTGWPIFLLLMMIAGFINANYHTYKIQRDYIKIDKKYFKNKIRLTAEIINISEKEKGRQLLLKPLFINEEAQADNSMLIRLMLKKNFDIESGYIINTEAMINAPPPPVLPNGYNFKRIAFYNKIDAVGFILGKLEVIDKKNNYFLQSVNNLRYKIIENIYNNIPQRSAAVATGLLTGERGKINKKDMDNIRNSGLAHLLAISGLHITLVSVIFLVIFRNIFVAIPNFALKYDIRKLAALFAILGSFIYLCLTQMPISGQRAFIMTSLILFGIMISRFNSPMRSVAIAAMFIMIISPSNILTPSFQMSFAAAIALIAGFQAIENVSYFKISSRYWPLKIIKYFMMTIISSLIAGFATLPFVLYHFQYWSKYGLLSNIIAVPLTSLWVMPFGILSLILMPFNLEYIPLKLMSLGIDIILSISDYIANIKHNISHITAIPIASLIIITLSLLWIVIWQTSFRKVGFITLVIGIISCYFNDNPSLIIDGERKLIAVIDKEKIYLSKTRTSFKRDYWQQYFGIEESDKLDNYDNYQCVLSNFNPYKDNKNFKYINNMKNSKKFNGPYFNCNLKYNGHDILLSSDIDYITQNCNNYDLIIAEHLFPNDIDNECLYNKHVITKKDLIKNGTYLINIKDNISFISVGNNVGKRPWS